MLFVMRPLVFVDIMFPESNFSRILPALLLPIFRLYLQKSMMLIWSNMKCITFALFSIDYMSERIKMITFCFIYTDLFMELGLSKPL